MSIVHGKHNFKSLMPECRRLIGSNFAYSFVFLILPIIANYFIWKEVGNDLRYNVVYFIGYFLSIPFGFALNGFLIARYKVNCLYIAGMMAEVFVIIPLFFLHLSTMPSFFIIGTIMGISSGLFWSNRHYMSMFVTTNLNRNYVLGVENTLMNLAGFLSPLIFGFLTGEKGLTLTTLNIGLNPFHGKIILALLLLSLIAFASYNILKAQYHNPVMKNFLFFKYCAVWNKQRFINILEGFHNGTLIVVPALITLKFFNDSGTLGLLDSVGIAVALMPIYLIARFTRPNHRISVIIATGIIFMTGALVLAIGFNPLTAIIFMFCAKIVFTVLYSPFLAVRMRSIELSRAVDQRDEYAYFIDIEAFLALGRMLGLGIFLALYFYGSQVLALRYGFVVIAIVPFIASYIISKIKQE